MMEARRVDSILRVHAEIDDVEKHFVTAVMMRGTAGRADDHEQFSVAQ